MNQVSITKRQFREEQWRQRITECRSSEMSVKNWCESNGLNVYTYLEYLLLYMPDTDWRNYLEELDNLMPWSETVQAECK